MPEVPLKHWAFRDGQDRKVLALKELTFSQKNNKKEKEGRKGGREGKAGGKKEGDIRSKKLSNSL